MIYREFGKTGFQASAVGQGCWNIGNQWGVMTDQEAEKILKTAFDNGVNVFDVADNYGSPNGTSEMRLGKALKGIRDQVFLVTKIGHWGERSGQALPYTTPDIIRLCGHASLGRLGTDYLDMVLCHNGDLEDPFVFVEGLEALQREGFIRDYGISTDRLDVLERFYQASGGKCAAVEMEYSILHMEPERNGMLEFCRRNHLAVLVRGVLGQGIVSGKYGLDTVFRDELRASLYHPGRPHRDWYEKRIHAMELLKDQFPGEDYVKLALSYVLSQEGDPVVIPGATRPEQARANARAGERLMDPKVREQIRKALETVYHGEGGNDDEAD